MRIKELIELLKAMPEKMEGFNFCKEGVVLNPKCNKVVSKYYCDIDAYDEETGCTNCSYKKKSEVRDEN